jgi:threonine dehydratase
MSWIKKRGIEAVTIADVRRAATRIEPLIHRTPVLTSRLVDAATGLQCFFKCENLQRGGAFKIRGAANFLLSIPPSERARGVVAFSSGNHAQAVAIAARELGVRAKIAMPTDAPAAKLEATKNYGAEVVFYDRSRDDREALARRLAEETGSILVPPFDHEWIIAGQGTAALELLEDVPNLDAIIACVGGGGLLAGTSITAKGIKPDILVFGAEPEQANDTYLSLRAGSRVEIPPPVTIADGLRLPKPGALTFPIVQEHVEDILLVSEQEIRTAVAFIQSRMKLVVEPSGAVAPATAFARKILARVRRVGLIISGGNV